MNNFYAFVRNKSYLHPAFEASEMGYERKYLLEHLLHIEKKISHLILVPGIDLQNQALSEGKQEHSFDQQKIDGYFVQTNFTSPFVERILEKYAAMFMLILLSPLFFLVGLFIKLTSRGPILYKQVRTGLNHQSFHIYKFRTMRMDAESRTGPTLSWAGDPRITVLGNFLRKSHIDELPQLMNVLKGDMSFIGPRPERPELLVGIEKSIPEYKLRCKVRPGITGLSQIMLPYDASPEEKIVWDLFSLLMQKDLKLKILVIFYTAKKALFLKMIFKRYRHVH